MGFYDYYANSCDKKRVATTCECATTPYENWCKRFASFPCDYARPPRVVQPATLFPDGWLAPLG
jgi:hypothetical protein